MALHSTTHCSRTSVSLVWGMAMGNKKMRERIAVLLNESMANDHTLQNSRRLLRSGLTTLNDADASKVCCC